MKSENWILAELCITLWLACAVYLLPLKRKEHFFLRAGTGIVCGSLILIVVHIFLGRPGLMGSMSSILEVFVCFLLSTAFLYACAPMELGGAMYCAAWALMTQQIAYELWYVLQVWFPAKSQYLVFAGSLLTYAVVYVLAGISIARSIPEAGTYRVGPRQLISAIVLLAVFEKLFEVLELGKNAGYWNPSVSGVLLIQVYCVTILYLQSALFKKSAMRRELDTLNQLWHQQKAQYELSRETIALINHKCHDLKHQIAAMRSIQSPEERDRYLREVEDSVQIYDAIVKTGNEVLDTVLTEKSLLCAANQIKINCIADGRRMDVMDPVDLYTVFGNAIDNAIESVRKLERAEMRLIDVIVYVRRQFLIINIMNPIGGSLHFEEGLPVTTKAKNGYHGFGLKSIRHIAEKYNGFMKIDTEQNIFSLKMLIPLQEGDSEDGKKQI